MKFILIAFIIILGLAIYTVIVLYIFNNCNKKDNAALFDKFKETEELHDIQMKQLHEINDKLITVLKTVANDFENKLSAISVELLSKFKNNDSAENAN